MNNTRRYRKISVQIWGDEKVRRLSNDGKLAFIFVLTHPNMTGIGAMRGIISGLAKELKVSEKAFREAFKEGLLEACEEAALIVAPRFLDHNAPENPNVVRSWVKLADSIPECALQRKHFARVKAFLEGFGKAFAEPWLKGMPKGMPNGMPKQEQEQEQEQKQDLPPTPQGERGGVKKRKSSQKPKATYPEAFEAFYLAYPRHRLGYKPTALEAWQSVCRSDATALQIMACLAAEKQSVEWLQENGRGITNADRWLLRELWTRPDEACSGQHMSEDEELGF